MSTCDQREAFLDGTLAPAERTEFLRHAASCATCTDALNRDASTRSALQAWGAAVPPLDPFAGPRLAAKAGRRRTVRRVGMFAAVSASALVVFLIARPAVQQLHIDAPGIVQSGDDTIVAEADSEADVQRSTEQTRVTLKRGACAFQVAKRKAGQRFVVETGGVEVRVVGTRFRVQSGASPTVDVTEGVVEVWKAGARVAELHAGDSWGRPQVEVPPVEPVPDPVVVDAGLPTPPSRPTLDVDRVTQAMLGGRLEDARRILEVHLRQVPNDGRAWMLLGDVRRKASEFPSAVQAYQRAATTSDAEGRIRARLQAAAVLEEKLNDLRGAKKELVQGLTNKAGPSLLEAPILVRLAKVERALGDTASAKARLKLVLDRYPSSPAATEARTLLETF